MKSKTDRPADVHNNGEDILTSDDLKTSSYQSPQEADASESAHTDPQAASADGVASDGADPYAALQMEIAHLRDSVLRRTAELENAKKRAIRERLQIFEESKSDALKAFLPINDDLQRSLQAAAGQDIPEAFLQGITLVAEKFSHILESTGIKPINEINVPFNVNLHDALMRRPADDPTTPSDTVLQILETGYKLGDRVIRHAKVIVSE